MTKEEFRNSITEVTLPCHDTSFTYFICVRNLYDISKTVVKFAIGDVRIITPNIMHDNIDTFDKDLNLVKSDVGYLTSLFNKIEISRTWNGNSVTGTSFGLPIEKTLEKNPNLYHSKKETLKIYNSIELAKEVLVENFFSRHFMEILKHK